MVRHVFANEKLLFAALGANGALEYLRHFALRFQPELTALLTILQITVAALTITHIVRKWILTHTQHEKTPPSPPPGDSFSV